MDNQEEMKRPIIEYIHEDIEGLSHKDLLDVYAYIRRHKIAKTGMKDPMEGEIEKFECKAYSFEDIEGFTERVGDDCHIWYNASDVLRLVAPFIVVDGEPPDNNPFCPDCKSKLLLHNPGHNQFWKCRCGYKLVRAEK